MPTARRLARDGYLADVADAEQQDLIVEDAAAWRSWLEEHHETEDSVWVVLAKKGVTGLWKDLPVPSADLSEVGWAPAK